MSLSATNVVASQPRRPVAAALQRLISNGEQSAYSGAVVGLAAVGVNLAESVTSIPAWVSSSLSSIFATSSIALLIRSAYAGFPSRNEKPQPCISLLQGSMPSSIQAHSSPTTVLHGT